MWISINKFSLVYLYVLVCTSQVVEKCPSIKPTPELHATCFYENRKLPNCSEPVQGTIVRYECGHFYDHMETAGYAVQVCFAGLWSYPRPKCVPTCGQKLVDAQTLIVGGTKTLKNEYPWQVAVYKENQTFACGGVLIDQRVVLTTATCVSRIGEEIPKSSFTLAFGKYYRRYDDPREEDVQFEMLDEIFIPDQYRGYKGNFYADIAVLVTKKPVVLSRKVRPICIDWTQSYKESESSQYGYVTGWGYVDDKQDLADELQELKVPIIEKTKCFSELRETFRKFLTSDKFCAGYLNESNVALGDSGGGLVLDHNDRYYLSGILNSCSRGKLDNVGTCSGYALYTNVLAYAAFILDKIKKIPPTTVQNHIGEETTIFNSTAWPKSGYYCPPIATTASTLASCISVDNEISDCLNATDGTVASFKCAPDYESAEIQNATFRICKNGTWNRDPPVCSPVCGIVPIQAQTLVVGGSDVEKGSFPWQAAIYKIQKRKRQKFICGATMIHPKVFLTAAHCVTQTNGYKLRRKSLYTVTVGKHYRKFNDSRDTHAQFSAIHEMFLPTEYQGYLQNYYGDIAILITEKEFDLSTYVRPVCVDWERNYELKPFLVGILAGWGFTEEAGELAEELKVLKVPYIDKDMCRDQIDPDYLPYLTFDKLCSGYLNQNKSACQGDSGSGLIFRNSGDGKYYIMGIVSLAPQAPTGGCNSQEYTLYTEVSFYVNSFIVDKVPKYG